MRYTTKELRNTRNPLLARLQRQVDEKNDKLYKKLKDKKDKIMKDKKDKLFCLDKEFDLDKEFKLVKINDTRFKRLNKRGSR